MAVALALWPPSRITSEPAGLLCRDLKAKGYPYVDAVTYWELHGWTDSMDADLNGIPCETVYSSSEVTLNRGRDVTREPAGQFCRDLIAKGYSYDEAVTYWEWYGSPDNMDTDLNGIPCETVYSAREIGDYWGFD